jgi:ribonuclease VapC
MVIDTSAIVAVLRLEAEADTFLRAIATTDACFMSALSVLETSMVLAGARDQEKIAQEKIWDTLDAFLAVSRIDIIPFDKDQALLARAAFLRFGKGRHPAALDLGDCASYALATTRKLPLLFKGNDFTKTDLSVAVPLPSTH